MKSQKENEKKKKNKLNNGIGEGDVNVISYRQWKRKWINEEPFEGGEGGSVLRPNCWAIFVIVWDVLEVCNEFLVEIIRKGLVAFLEDKNFQFNYTKISAQMSFIDFQEDQDGSEKFSKLKVKSFFAKFYANQVKGTNLSRISSSPFPGCCGADTKIKTFSVNSAIVLKRYFSKKMTKCFVMGLFGDNVNSWAWEKFIVSVFPHRIYQFKSLFK